MLNEDEKVNTQHYLFSIIKKYKKKEMYGVIIALICNLAAFANPYLSKRLIDSVSSVTTMRNIRLNIFVFFLICLSRPFGEYFRNIVFRIVSESVTLDVKTGLFHKVLHSTYRFFDKTSKGDIISRITNDGEKLGDFITNLWLLIVNNVIFLFVSLIGMLMLSVPITFLIVLIMTVYTLYNICRKKI